MIELLHSMLNPSATDPSSPGYGGTPELTLVDILACLQGCDDPYTTLLIAAVNYSQNDICYVNTLDLSKRKIIVDDCIAYYRRYLGVTRQKMKIHVNTMAYISNAAIDAEIMFFKHDDKKLLLEMQKFDYEISKYKFDTKYKEIINQCFMCIGDNLRPVFSKLRDRLEKN